jgi:DNA polymerase I-like protein with 3'-5' exonuclease and polymerase domains
VGLFPPLSSLLGIAVLPLTLSKTYELVNTRERLLEVAAEVAIYHRENPDAFLGLDFETIHLLPKRYEDEVPKPIRTKKGLRGKASLMQLGLDPEIRDWQYVIDILALNKLGVTDAEIGDLFRDVLESAKILGFNLKYEYQFAWRQFAIRLRHMRCIMLFAQVLFAGDELIKFGFATLCSPIFGQALFGWFLERTRQLYGREMDYDQFVAWKKSQQKSEWSGELIEEQVRYAAGDVALPFDQWKRLCEMLDQFIDQYGQKAPGDIAGEIMLEWEAIPAFAMMELRGFKLDIQKHKALCQYLLDLIDKAQAEVGKYFTHPVKKNNGKKGKERKVWEEIETINLKSHQQIKAALHSVGVKVPSTKEAILQDYVDQHPAVQAILDHKSAQHMYSNFGPKLLDLVEDTGRLHYDLWQCGTTTGRSSAGNPNLQQIPAEAEYRESFICEMAHSLTIADYSQIEPRLTAWYTGDLVQEFKQTGEDELDMHSLTGRDMLDLDYLPKKGDPNRDVIGKKCNLGLTYREGAKKLAMEIYTHTKGLIDWTVNDFKEAKARLEKYWEKRQKTKRKMEVLDRMIKERAAAAGTLAPFVGRKPIAVVWSKAGRPRRFCLPAKWEKEGVDLTVLQKSAKYWEWGLFEKILGKFCTAGWNHASAQSVAASILKRAVVNIHNDMEAAGFDYDDEGIIGVVHDEVICETVSERAEEVAQIIERRMLEAERPFLGEVPAKVNIVVGCATWWDGKG